MKQETTLNALLLKEVCKYYLMGLNAKEIGKLLDVSQRTVQRYLKKGKVKENAAAQTLPQKALLLKKQGFSYTEIAKKIKCSKTTVYNYIKKSKELKQSV